MSESRKDFMVRQVSWAEARANALNILKRAEEERAHAAAMEAQFYLGEVEPQDREAFIREIKAATERVRYWTRKLREFELK